MRIALPLPNHKNGHGRRECDLAADLKGWLADLDAARALRREQLRLLNLKRRLPKFEPSTKQ